jgi:hypothetical protein
VWGCGGGSLMTTYISCSRRLFSVTAVFAVIQHCHELGCISFSSVCCNECQVFTHHIYGRCWRWFCFARRQESHLTSVLFIAWSSATSCVWGSLTVNRCARYSAAGEHTVNIYMYVHRCASISADSVSVVYRSHKKKN